MAIHNRDWTTCCWIDPLPKIVLVVFIDHYSKKKGNWEQSNKKILCLIVRLVFIEGKLGLITGQQSIGHCIIHAMNTPEKLLSFLEYVYSANKPTISRGVLRALDIMKGSTG